MSRTRCTECGKIKREDGDCISYYDYCNCYRQNPESFTITINGQTEEIRLLREISSKLSELIELIGKL